MDLGKYKQKVSLTTPYESTPEAKGKTKDEVEKDIGVIKDISYGVVKSESDHNLGEFYFRELSSDEQEVVQDRLDNARTKLLEMGFTEKEIFLPSLAEMRYRLCNRGSDPTLQSRGGHVSNKGERIVVDVFDDTDLKDPQVAQVEYHEYSHFLRRVTLRSKVDINNNLAYTTEQISRGFGRTIYIRRRLNTDDQEYYEDKNKYKTVLRRGGYKPADIETEITTGVYEEGLSDLFMLYCMDTPIQRESPYTTHAPFILSFIQRIAELEGKTEKEVFFELFKAETLKDYSYQGHLVSLFDKLQGEDWAEASSLGTTIMRMLNNIVVRTALNGKVAGERSTIHIDREQYEILEQIAEFGGFKDRLHHNMEMMNSTAPDGGIGIDGIKGRLIAQRERRIDFK
jgi:hypothetical protein